MVYHSTQKVEAGGYEIHGHPWQVPDQPGHMKACLKNNKNKAGTLHILNRLGSWVS